MKNRRTIRIILFITAIMMLQIGAVKASAATVASIGRKNYSSLDKALSAAKNGDTIKLKRNASYHMNWYGYDQTGQYGGQGSPDLKKKITLNLNRKTLTVKDHSWGKVRTGGDLSIESKSLTIKNGTIVGSVSIEKNAYLKMSNVKLKHGTLSSISGVHAYTDGSKASLKNCSSDNIKISVIGKNSRVTVENCKFTCKQEELFSVGQSVPMKASLTIKGGVYTYKGDDYLLNIQKSGILNINGGTFTVMEKEGGANEALNLLLNYGTTTIRKGTFTKPLGIAVSNDGKLTMSGGSIKGSQTGVRCSGGSRFTMTGGKITSTHEYSTTIQADSVCNLRITGGTLVSAGHSAVSGPKNGTIVGSRVKMIVPDGKEAIHYF